MVNTPSYKIAVVDDDKDILYALRRIIERCGHTVYTADSVASGTDLLNSVNPDIVFCDMRLREGLSGEDFLGYVTEHHPNTGIVMMSCSMPYSDKRRLESGGALACLQKPFFGNDCKQVISLHTGNTALAA